MNIFFTASLYDLGNSKEEYSILDDLVKKAGHKLNTSFVIKTNQSSSLETDSYQKLISEIKKCDALFADSSNQSFSAGYFVSQALQLNKPVVIFFKGNKEPHIFKQLENNLEKVMILRYPDSFNFEKDIHTVLNFINEVQDTRFNFFVSPDLSSYLDWISKNKKIPRSVYLRELIEADMLRQSEY